jgi:recombination protein RecA
MTPRPTGGRDDGPGAAARRRGLKGPGNPGKLRERERAGLVRKDRDKERTDMVKKDTNKDAGLGRESETDDKLTSRHKAIDAALSQIEKQFGKGTIMKLGQKGAAVAVEAIPTGSISFDIALGISGFPRGRVVEIYGPEATGKTTLALHVIAEAQKRGGQAAFIDAEHALSPSYAAQIGIDIDNLLISQPDFGEQALEIAEVLVRSGAVDVIVVDSVAALVPKAELEGEMGDAHMGLQARLMSQALRKLTAIVARSKTCFIFINQIREKIGVFIGNPETTTGGRALKFYASLRIDVRRLSVLKDGESVVGNRVKVKIVKNKMAPPFREAQFDIIFGQGISREGDLVDTGFDLGILEKTGTWYSYKGERLGQGRENVKRLLKENTKLAAEIEEGIRARLGLGDEKDAAKDVA